MNSKTYNVKANYPNNDQPDFSSLTGIMSHFHVVPYTQFQLELDQWFLDGLTKAGLDDCAKGDVLNTLKEIFEKIRKEEYGLR